ncbi:MAG: hypothetical protein QOD09_3221 [Bradyrhizobium sp.]|jgi:hypothetical protein|nr:hypothetical protein [Bradyrhizobium sp.]
MDIDTTHQDQRCRDGDPDDRTSCVSGSRNRYFPRKTMTADDFTREQAYAIGRRRLLNRAIHGWGVVYGLGVKLDGQHLTIDPGLALDRHGREVVVAVPHALRHTELFVRVNGQRDPSHAPKPTAGRWLLSAHYAERPMDQVRLAEQCNDCGKPEWNRVCETAVFSLTAIDAKSCPTAEPGCPGDCGCPKQPARAIATDGYTPLEPAILVIKPKEALKEQALREPADNATAAALKEPTEKEDPANLQRIPAPVSDKLDPIPPYPRGPHSTLCCWSHHAHIEGDGSLCAWNQYCVDPDDPVPIACVTLVGFDKCGDPVFGEIEECTPRRIVKSNDLLFDLIRGCDLTRIKAVSWADWALRDYVDWSVFKDNFDRTASLPQQPLGCLTKLQIDFSGPVQKSTITPDTVAITVVLHDSGTGWGQVLRIPIIGFVFGGDPNDDTTRTARVVVRRDWVNGEISIDANDADRSTKFEAGARRPEWYPRVEVEIFGDLILDCRGQPVDANSVGPRIVPTGNGTPGGTCRLTFRVVPPSVSRSADSTPVISTHIPA